MINHLNNLKIYSLFSFFFSPQALLKMKRELRSRMEREIGELQRIIIQNNEDDYFQELEIQRLRNRVRMASFQYNTSYLHWPRKTGLTGLNQRTFCHSQPTVRELDEQYDLLRRPPSELCTGKGFSLCKNLFMCWLLITDELNTLWLNVAIG